MWAKPPPVLPLNLLLWEPFDLLIITQVRLSPALCAHYPGLRWYIRI